MTLFILLFFVLLLGLSILLITLFNGLVRKRNTAKNQFAQIDVQLKRRHDLIPNLVSTADQYLIHEKQTLENVIAARNRASDLQKDASHSAENPGHMDLLAKAEGMLSKALGQFYAVVEDYPELKANEIVMEVMNELKNTEDRIGFSRQSFNDSVMFYNDSREQFPGNIVAAMFTFNEINLLQFEDANSLQNAPSVSFSQK